MHLEEPPKLVQPRTHKAKVAIWADLTVSDMDLLEESVAPDQIKLELARIFNVEDYKENLKNGILIDLYYYTIQFCRDNNFSKEQTSAFFSIVKQTHEVCIETPFGNVEETFSYFRELVLCHAVKRPPFSIDLFTPVDVKSITEYVINTYFRHLKMYKYVFTPLVRLDLSMQYHGLPPTPAPSEAGGDTAREGAEDEKTDDQDAASQQGEKKDGEENQTASEKGGDEEEKTGTEQTDGGGNEESPAARELRKLVRQHLSEEIQKLKQDMDQQMRESEDCLNQKLSSVEPKGGRGSGKGKRK